MSTWIFQSVGLLIIRGDPSLSLSNQLNQPGFMNPLESWSIIQSCPSLWQDVAQMHLDLGSSEPKISVLKFENLKLESNDSQTCLADIWLIWSLFLLMIFHQRAGARRCWM